MTSGSRGGSLRHGPQCSILTGQLSRQDCLELLNINKPVTTDYKKIDKMEPLSQSSEFVIYFVRKPLEYALSSISRLR